MSKNKKQLTIIRPDDWHLHVRDDEALNYVVPHTAERFGRAIIMPNLLPPVNTSHQAQQYYSRIKSVLSENHPFEPLMTLYATDNMTPDVILDAHASGVVKAVKVYPAGATTNSDSGVTDIRKLSHVLATMQEVGMPLLVHGEVTDKDIDVFDRESVYIETILKPLVDAYPNLKIVFEHITTKQAAHFIAQAGDTIAATITPQHLLLNRNAIFAGGLRPHHYCLPVLKREQHREALVELATSGHPRVFLGTDSAPHEQGKKENSCGCAGIYSAFAGIELYAEAFERAGKLEQLEAFASMNGPAFYNLPKNNDTITLERSSWDVPSHFPYCNDGKLVPLFAGDSINWKIVEGLRS